MLDAQELQLKRQANPAISTCPSLLWFLLLALVDWMGACWGQGHELQHRMVGEAGRALEPWLQLCLFAQDRHRTVSHLPWQEQGMNLAHRAPREVCASAPTLGCGVTWAGTSVCFGSPLVSSPGSGKQ